MKIANYAGALVEDVYTQACSDNLIEPIIVLLLTFSVQAYTSIHILYIIPSNRHFWYGGRSIKVIKLRSQK